jgi:hypothetical protein
MANMVGSDFITKVMVRPNPTVEEQILAKFPISPSAYTGTRLTQLADLWEFYKFNNLALRYVPAVPVSLACQLVLYVDLDPSDDPTVIPNADALIRQAVAQTGAQQWNFHVPKRIPMALRNDRQFFFTGVDKQNVRFSQQGMAYLIQITSPVNFNGEPIATEIEAGSIFFDWNIGFNIPQINPSAITNTRIGFDDDQTVGYVRIVPGMEQFHVVGLRPKTKFVVSPIITVPSEAGYILKMFYNSSDDDGAFFRYSLGAENMVYINNQSSNRMPGFVIIETDIEGSSKDFFLESSPSLDVFTGCYLRFSALNVGISGISTPIRYLKSGEVLTSSRMLLGE